MVIGCMAQYVLPRSASLTDKQRCLTFRNIARKHEPKTTRRTVNTIRKAVGIIQKRSKRRRSCSAGELSHTCVRPVTYRGSRGAGTARAEDEGPQKQKKDHRNVRGLNVERTGRSAVTE